MSKEMRNVDEAERILSRMEVFETLDLKKRFSEPLAVASLL